MKELYKQIRLFITVLLLDIAFDICPKETKEKEALTKALLNYVNATMENPDVKQNTTISKKETNKAY